MYDPLFDTAENDFNSMPPEKYWETTPIETDLCQLSEEDTCRKSPPLKRRKCENATLKKFYGFSTIEDFLQFGFNKKFSFSKFPSPNLSASQEHEGRFLYRTVKWKETLSEFGILKQKLNAVKTRLNDYDLNEWHDHTRSSNPASLVMRTIKNKTKQEFLTQAWCKFYELICEFDLIPSDVSDSQALFSVHLCEAPGAFVTSLHHYLKSNHPTMKWRWIANSLNPYYEGNSPAQMISDDRFMLETVENWDFGPDMTGDITHPNYPEHLKRKCGDHLPNLITADGSFDCQDVPEEQENSVSWLFLKETLTALRILKTGGHFVLKMFTFFECDTICLLYLLNNVFVTVDVIKPLTSKEGNSEVYVVSRGFKGIASVPEFQDLFDVTLEQHRKYAMFPFEVVHRDFINSVLNCAEQFAGYQTEIIERNIRLFEDRHNVELQRLFKFIQNSFTHKFSETYRVKRIELSECMIPHKSRAFKARRRTLATETRSSSVIWSHTDRIKKKNRTREEVFELIFDELNSLNVNFWVKENLIPEIDVDVEDFKVVYCKPIRRVVSSLFCHSIYLRMVNELKDTISVVTYNNIIMKSCENLSRDNEVRVCDLRPIYVQNETYSEAQSLAYQKIWNVVLELKDGDDCVLINFSTLTQFDINVLCLLRQIFKKIEFKNVCTFHLHCANIDERDKWKMKWEEISEGYTKDCAVLSFLPLDLITGVKNPLYLWLLDVNNVRCDVLLQFLLRMKMLLLSTNGKFPSPT